MSSPALRVMVLVVADRQVEQLTVVEGDDREGSLGERPDLALLAADRRAQVRRERPLVRDELDPDPCAVEPLTAEPLQPRDDPLLPGREGLRHGDPERGG